MAWTITRSLDAFTGTVGELLRSDPVQHTVPLTVLAALSASGPSAIGDDPPRYGWHTGHGGIVNGAFLQTPPFPVLVAALPSGSAPGLIQLLIEWAVAFDREASSVVHDSERTVDDRLSHAGLTLWEIGGQPVAMAGRTRDVAGVVRVGPVYTAPAHRQRGYGGAVTTAVTQAALDGGASAVVLFTDLANPTSNALYQRLGYRPVGDRVLLDLHPG
jgi:GNAT superfamily N-acetyltransferase